MSWSDHPNSNPKGWILPVVMVIGIAMRLAMYFSGKSLWSDEFWSLQLVQNGYWNVFKGAIHDVHPPVYFLILHTFTKLFGYSELALRLPSLLAGIAVLFGIYHLTKLLFKEEVALLATGLIGISPYWLQLSNEVRGFGLVACLVTWATWAYLKEIKWLYVLLAVTSLFTEHYAWIWFAGLIFMDRRRN